MQIKPETRLGKWSVGLNIIFLVVIAVALILVLVLGILDFGDKWWDATVPIAFVIEMTAFITGIMAVRKNKERSTLVYLSVVTGILTILFVFLHSLFVSD
jgi:hypothetical protein